MKLIIDQTAIDEVLHERESKENSNLFLRVTVEGGGCSGFQYKYEWDDSEHKDDDSIFDKVVFGSIFMMC